LDGWRDVRAVDLMNFGVIKFTRDGDERHEADPPRDVAAGVLKMAELFDEIVLARADASLVKRVNMVQYPDQNLQPLVFGTSQFFHFQTQVVFLGIVR